MRLWILKDSEQLPLIPGAKQMRAGMLADTAQSRGHDVTWWCSTINHMKKTLYANEDQSQTLTSGVTLRMLHAGLYTSNLSLARLRHHRRLAKRWREVAEQSAEAPDLILAAYPIIEWVREAIAYAKPRGIPVIVDVRDLWPDTFADYMPAPLKPLVKLASSLLYPYAGRALREATLLTSMSSHVLRWAIAKSGRTDEDKCRVFYLGTELADQPFHRKPLPVAGEKIRACFLGSLNHTVDVISIAKAAKILTDQNAPIHITIAGDGPEMATLKTYREDQRATFVLPGWQDKEAGRKLLENHDIALFTGHAAAMPNKLFDYIAAGLPIVCSVRGEGREYVEQHQLGRTCPSGDPEALAQAIRAVAENLKIYSDNVANIPHAHYSKQAIYTAFTEFLESQVKTK